MSTPQESKAIVDKLKRDCNNDYVENLGYNRFVVREPYSHKSETGEPTSLYKDRIFDENCNEIPLQNEYNAIFHFSRGGIAIVRIWKSIRFHDDKFSSVKLNGIINLDGKELYPCEYDNIKIYAEGAVDFTKDGLTKRTFLDKIINQQFNWDNEEPWAG